MTINKYPAVANPEDCLKTKLAYRIIPTLNRLTHASKWQGTAPSKAPKQLLGHILRRERYMRMTRVVAFILKQDIRALR